MSGKTGLANELRELCCARVPLTEMPRLAGLRTTTGVEALVRGDQAWLRWQVGDVETLRCVWPIQGVKLYAERGGLWFELGHHLPSFDIPEGDFRPVHQVLIPHWKESASFEVYSSPQRLHLTLVNDTHPKATSAIRCHADTLLRWSEMVPTQRLAELQAVCWQDELLVLGTRLPMLPRSRRYHGATVLIPLGQRTAPVLPEAELRKLVGAEEDEVVLLDDGADIIPRPAFAPLSRRALRRMCAESRP